jgi:hypothetical protein
MPGISGNAFLTSAREGGFANALAAINVAAAITEIFLNIGIVLSPQHNAKNINNQDVCCAMVLQAGYTAKTTGNLCGHLYLDILYARSSV